MINKISMPIKLLITFLTKLYLTIYLCVIFFAIFVTGYKLYTLFF